MNYSLTTITHTYFAVSFDGAVRCIVVERGWLGWWSGAHLLLNLRQRLRLRLLLMYRLYFLVQRHHCRTSQRLCCTNPTQRLSWPTVHRDIPVPVLHVTWYRWRPVTSAVSVAWCDKQTCSLLGNIRLNLRPKSTFCANFILNVVK